MLLTWREKKKKFWGIYYLKKAELRELSLKKIGDILGYPKSAIQSMVNRVNTSGSPLPQRRQGAPKKLNEKAERSLARVIKETPFITYDDHRLPLNTVRH